MIKRKFRDWIIVLFVIVLMSGFLGINVSATTPTEIQTKVHEIAETARSLGLAEDDPIIVRAQELWWAAEKQRQYEIAKAVEVKPTLKYLGVYKITGYDPYCSHCCGKSDGITASGAKAVPGVTVAMKNMPFGTRIYIEGLGYYTVQDRGGFGNGVIDVACVNHSACYAITGSYKVYLVEG